METGWGASTQLGPRPSLDLQPAASTGPEDGGAGLQPVETPRLWAWAKIWVNGANMAVMPDILGNRRLQGVKEFIADGCKISEEVVKARVGKQNKTRRGRPR